MEQIQYAMIKKNYTGCLCIDALGLLSGCASVFRT